MPKTKTFYTCQECEAQSPQWLGRCPQCGAWNSFIEGQSTNVPKTKATASALLVGQDESINPIKLSEVEVQATARIKSDITELDRVLGGGIVPGSAVLIGGEPGIGKSTLVLQLALKLSETENVLYVSGEENPSQIKMRADRLSLPSDRIQIFAQPDINQVIEYAHKQSGRTILIVDSVQTVYVPEVDATAGTVNQVKEVTARLVRFAKSTKSPVLIIGHVTKDGTIAGPKVLEHLVDTVIYLEGERYQDLRMLRAVKNRFGAASELGLFEMTESGMSEVKNPSQLFLEGRTQGPGAIAAVIMEGVRPIIVEIQALVTKSFIPVPRRTAQGYDNNRLQMLIAVLQKKLKVSLYEQDIFVNIVGGIRVQEPAADFSICLAILSSYYDKTLPATQVAFGEIGLQGEIRRVSKENKRSEEANKLGFTSILTSQTYQNLTQIKKLFQ